MIWMPDRGQKFRAFQKIGGKEHCLGLFLCTGRRLLQYGGGNGKSQKRFVVSAGDFEFNELVWRFERAKG